MPSSCCTSLLMLVDQPLELRLGRAQIAIELARRVGTKEMTTNRHGEIVVHIAQPGAVKLDHRLAHVAAVRIDGAVVAIVGGHDSAPSITWHPMTYARGGC